MARTNDEPTAHVDDEFRQVVDQRDRSVRAKTSVSRPRPTLIASAIRIGTSAMNHPLESIPSGEARDIEAITRISLDILDADRRPVRRGQHPKQHGCVRAEFHVEPDAPEDLRIGVFRVPRVFPAYIRFSNGSSDDDTLGDIRGMAIKLLGVDGPKALDSEPDGRTQDFVLASHPAFFSKDARSNRGLGEAMRSTTRPKSPDRLLFWMRPGRKRRSAWIALRHFLLPLRLRELKVLRDALSLIPEDLLAVTYWSATPYALGDRAVKYVVRPRPADGSASDAIAASDPKSPDRLRRAMAARLANGSAEFDFFAQVQADPRTMPVEDASIAWDEKAAPPRKVATIRIPSQTFESPEQLSFCENLSFTPWRALVEHRPIGGVNRARRRVYEALSRKRHELNGEPMTEPAPWDSPPNQPD